MIRLEGKFLGIDRKTMYHSIPNNLVWNGEDKDNILFKATDVGQFDFLVYTVIVYNSNPMGIFYTNINRMARLLGYKPRTGKNNINDRIKQSLERLKENWSLDYKIEDGLYCIQAMIPENEKHFFKLYYYTIEKILGLDYINKEDIEILGASKYKNKSKALYVYCYIVARMNNIKVENYSDTISCCYPSIKEICNDCNIGDEGYLIKLLKYFELDRILFTTNIGQIKNGILISNANNYYTLNIDNIYGACYYSKGYYYSRGYNIDDENFKITLAKEINELAIGGAEKLFKTDKQKALLYIDRINAEFKILLQEANLKIEDYNEWENSNGQFRSKYRNILNAKNLLYLFDNWKVKVEFLNHVKNCIEAIAIMYEVK